MIVSIFYFLIGSFVALLVSLLSAITAVVPENIQASMAHLASYFKYFKGIINFSGIFAAFDWYIIMLAAWFTFLAVMWFWHKLPWIGKHHKGNDKK